ncbi:MAG: 4-(cytidine 5'-diphospho)-2-C-methyl-D-erythritol kinase [Bacteroidales bacterium]|nr:4-(cytidine 5'-diphospho)-2-C-methyl-D-erythritol kinase [Bacteroidales bacterium]
MITRPNVKVNLGLNVLRRREDGYHDIETLFVPSYECSDTLEIIAGDDWSRTSARLSGLYDASSGQISQAISEDGKLMITIARKEGVDWDPLSDLTAKAYRLLDGEFGLGSVKIFLEKTSPVGAGLGGGSADAAFALRMLSELFELGLSDDTLSAYASKLGSDCAFFVWNRPMIGEGRGEILSEYALEGIDFGGNEGGGYVLKLVVPEGMAVSTAEAYRGICPGMPEIPLREALARPVEQWKDCLVNDFEKTVFVLHPELAAIKASLYEAGAVYAGMSGSGSALFAIYRKA